MRVGIAGFGKMGKNHFNEFKKDENFKLCALYDVKKNEEFKGLCFDDLKEFLNQNLDLVVISSPTSTHLDLAKEIFKKVKLVLIEKPLALNLAQMQEIKTLAQKYQVKVSVGFSERFNPAILALKKALENEDLISIDIQRFSPYPTRINDVGVLQDLAVHDLDLLGFLSGKKIKTCQILKRQIVNKKYEDEASLFCELEHIIAFLHQSWNSACKIRRVSVICKNAYYEANLNDFILLKNNEQMKLLNTSPLFNEHKELLDFSQGLKGNLAGIEDAIAVQELLEFA